jgi:DNA-binding response OmpR family regulator
MNPFAAHRISHCFRLSIPRMERSRFSSAKVEVLILDLRLKQGKGFGVLRGLRKRPQARCRPPDQL